MRIIFRNLLFLICIVTCWDQFNIELDLNEGAITAFDISNVTITFPDRVLLNADALSWRVLPYSRSPQV